MRQAAILFIFMCLITGCSYSMGKKVNMEETKKIEKGVTTKSEIKEMFGEPNRIMQEQNQETWMYNYSKHSVWGGYSMLLGGKAGAKGQLFMISFDADGVVTNYSSSTSEY